MRVVSLFSGCGGLDLGFEHAGFEIVYSNDVDESVWLTYEKNLKLEIDKRSLFDIPSSEIPQADGIIGGPPCQSWSLAGAMRGAKDSRGQLFFEYVRVIKDKHPAFFLAENVPGILSPAHVGEFNNIVSLLKGLGYRISYKTIDSRDYGVPQERKRVIIVGYDEGLGKKFEFPTPSHSRQSVFSLDGGFRSKWVTLRQAIGDMPKAVQSGPKNKPNSKALLPNHEYMTGGFSTIYMSRNRKKSWDQQSFTIQAGGRHAPLHPSSCEMRKVQEDEWVFVSKKKSAHRRMSIRECARIQTFPDDFVFYYDRVSDGYKMVGNAVPVALAKALAAKIKSDLAELLSAKGDSLKPGILA